MAFNIDILLRSKGAAQVRQDLDGVGRSAGTAGQQTSAFAGRLQAMGTAAVAAGAALAAFKLAEFVRGSVAAFETQERALAQLEATIQSTGGAAGFSVSQLEVMASSLQHLTGVGDEATLQMQSVLGTFTRISGGEFARASAAVLDVATKMNNGLLPSAQQLTTQAVQLGKALNDPVANLGALSRSGIQFSEAQKELISSLVETNQVAEAQRVILDELEAQFGGSAEAARDTLGGAMSTATSAASDLQEQIGRALSPGLRTLTEDFITAAQGATALARAMNSVEEEGETVGGVLADTAVRAQQFGLAATLAGEVASFFLGKLRELSAEAQIEAQALQMAEAETLQWALALGQAAAGATEEQKALSEGVALRREVEARLKAIREEMDRGKTATREYNEAIERTRQLYRDMREAADLIVPGFHRIGREMMEVTQLGDGGLIPMFRELGQVGEVELPSSFDATEDAVDKVGVSFTDMASVALSAFAAIQAGGDDLASTLGAIGAGIGAIIGASSGNAALGSQIGGLAGNLLGGLFGGGDSTVAQGSFTGSTSQAFGQEAAQLQAAFEDVRGVLEEIEQITGASLGNLQRIEIDVRESGAVFARIGNDAFQQFSSVQEALGALTRTALRGADLGELDEVFQQLIQGGAGDLEQLLSDISFVADLASASLDPFLAELNELSTQADNTRQRLFELGLSTLDLANLAAEANAAFTGNLDSIRAQITGQTKSQEELLQERADIFNAFLEQERARIEFEIASKQAEIESLQAIANLNVTITASMIEAAGIFGEALERLLLSIGASAARIEAIQAEIESLRRLLDDLPDPISDDELTVPSRRRGGGQQRGAGGPTRRIRTPRIDNTAQELDAFFRTLEGFERLELDPVSQALAGLEDQFVSLAADAIRLEQDLGRVEGALDIALSDFLDGVKAPITDLLRDIGLGQAGAPTNVGAQLNAALGEFDALMQAALSGDLSAFGGAADAAALALSLIPQQFGASKEGRDLQAEIEAGLEALEAVQVESINWDELLVEAQEQATEEIKRLKDKNRGGFNDVVDAELLGADDVLGGVDRHRESNERSFDEWGDRVQELPEDFWKNSAVGFDPVISELSSGFADLIAESRDLVQNQRASVDELKTANTLLTRVRDDLALTLDRIIQ